MNQKGEYYRQVMDRIQRDTIHENFYMLNILIPSIPSRKDKLTGLLIELRKQIAYVRAIHPALGVAKIIVDDSKSFLDGGLSIGKKRESLVRQTQGKYLCFLDDDESIAPNYVETILRLCLEDKDVCTFRSISKLDNYWTVIDMSLKNENEQASDQDIIKRKPWHICPVRSDYAREILFPDINYGEDWVWFEKVLEKCRNEAKTNAIIHQYNHSIKKSEANKAHEKSSS